MFRVCVVCVCFVCFASLIVHVVFFMCKCMCVHVSVCLILCISLSLSLSVSLCLSLSLSVFLSLCLSVSLVSLSLSLSLTENAELENIVGPGFTHSLAKITNPVVSTSPEYYFCARDRFPLRELFFLETCELLCGPIVLVWNV